MAKKKLIKKYSVNALFIGTALFMPQAVINLNAETNSSEIKAVNETWKRTGSEDRYFGEEEQPNSVYTVTSYSKYTSNLGNTKEIKESVTKQYYDAKGLMSKSEMYIYEEGKLVTKWVDFMHPATNNFFPKSSFVYSYDETGKSYIESKTYYADFVEDSPRKLTTYSYDTKGQLIMSSVVKMKGNFTLESDFTEIYTNGVITETYETEYYGQQFDDIKSVVNDVLNNKGTKESTKITEYYQTGEVKAESTISYYPDGKTKKELKTTEFDVKGLKTKEIYNAFSSNGKKKLARDTYYYANGKTKKQIRENHYNANGIKIKNIVGDYYSNGKRKLARDTYYYTNGKTIKEIRQNQYTSQNVKTKNVYNTFYSNGKKKLARDTYYHENGTTKKVVKENQYNSKGMKTKYIVNYWDKKGKATLYKDTYYKANGKVKEIRTSSFSSTGKKTSSVKKY